jgi:class 3 adenylate cyclase
VQLPETRYARSGDVNVAYQVFGEGPFDLVVVPGSLSHVELCWDVPRWAEMNRRLASFARTIVFDKRGTGMSDRVSPATTLETRIDDIRAVMDAAGSDRAALLGISEGAPISMLFAATYPERVWALVSAGGFANVLWTPETPWNPTEAQYDREVADGERRWGDPGFVAEAVRWIAPNLDEPNQAALAKLFRQSASPGALAALDRMNKVIDVRPALSSIGAPTVVINRAEEVEHHREGSRYVAERIPGARHVVLPGRDHVLFAGDMDAYLTEIESFLRESWETATAAPAEPDRVLATVLFTDIVDSTVKAVELGDARWRQLVSEHHRVVRRELRRHRGRELDTAGDGFFASFDGPARGIRCAAAIRDAVRELGIDVRAGIHTGECELFDGKVAGIAVVTGARIAALGGAGDVLVSATVRDLVAGSGIAFEDRGVHVLKGLPEERQLFAVRAV